MTYQVRNSLVLAGFLVLILMVSIFFIIYHYPKQVNELNQNISNLKKQIAKLDGIEQEYNQIEQLFKDQEVRLANLKKHIVSQVTPAETYQYLNTVLQYSGVLDFNLHYVEEKNSGNYMYKVFRIKGEGSFDRLYKFVSFLERGPEFYKIDKISLNLVEEKDDKTGKINIVVPFSIELWALFADVEELPNIHRTLDDVRVASVRNPFYPYIKGNLPPNTDNLLEVDRAELKAVMPDKILVADHTGKIHALKQGSEVYLGYLSHILVDNNQAEFILNKGGIVEKVVLQLMFDTKIN